MSVEMEICNICLKLTTTISVQDFDKDNVKWCVKLQDIIPELEWLKEYVICEYCCEQLHKAWDFKKTVLSLEKDRKNGITKEIYVKENIRNNSYTDYLCDNKKDIYCDICFKNFTTKTQLLQHKLQIHERSTQKEQILHNAFTCYNCNATFNFKENLISHIENECRKPELQSSNSQVNQVNRESHNITKVLNVLEDESNTSTQPFDTKDIFESSFEVCGSYEENEKYINSLQTVYKQENNEVYSQESGSYYCDKCKISFSSTQNLNLHNFCKHKLQEDNTQTSTQPFSTKNILEPSFEICKEENEEYIQKLGPYHCERCNVSFPSMQNLNSHNLCKHKVQEDKVQISPSINKRRGRKPQRKFNCEVCNKEFAYVKLVIEHCASVHNMDVKVVKPYSCEQCDMRFASSANLDQHRNYHSKNRAHICSLCGKGFITKSDLTVHEYTHFNRRNYKCSMCDKAFNTNKNLRTHNLVVHTDRSLWKYVCSICEKRFPLKTNYDQHLRRHKGEKEFICHICKKSFISKSELQRHVHMHSNIRAFKCNNCDKEYKERRTYQVHLAKKHGIGNVKISIREKKFVCHICPSQFYDKQKLMRHICSHSGLKPFPCFMCDKKFTDKSYLKHHLKVTHKIVDHSKTGDLQ